MSHDYDARRATIAMHAWETWTENGLGLDTDGCIQTGKTVCDAANNAYVDGIDDLDWLAATLRRLRRD